MHHLCILTDLHVHDVFRKHLSVRTYAHTKNDMTHAPYVHVSQSVSIHAGAKTRLLMLKAICFQNIHVPR